MVQSIIRFLGYSDCSFKASEQFVIFVLKIALK